MDDLLKVWTTVGSAGTLNQTDLAKVSLHQSVIQLGTELLPPVDPQVATGVSFPTIQAVVRYNVTPVDGLFITGADKFRYFLRIRFRGQITAKLMEVDLDSGTETQLILFDSNSFPPNPNFQVQAVGAKEFSALMDFVTKAYYVEATLVTSELVAGKPAAISIIKIFASPFLTP